MEILLMILGALAIGLGLGLMNSEPPKKRPWKPKSDWSLKSYWKSLDDYDMNYGNLSMEKRKKRNH